MTDPSRSLSVASSIRARYGQRYFYRYDHKCRLHICINRQTCLMRLILRDDTLDEQVTVTLSPEANEALRIQRSRCQSDTAESVWKERLRTSMENALLASLDWDIRPPTKAQVQYAIAIAKALRVGLPGEALQHQGAMREFLDRHADVFKAMNQRPSLGAKL